MSKSFKDLKDLADSHKVMRIIETESGHKMKRVFSNTSELKYKDVELTNEEVSILDSLEDVPH